jgi:hypothetical protein
MRSLIYRPIHTEPIPRYSAAFLHAHLRDMSKDEVQRSICVTAIIDGLRTVPLYFPVRDIVDR